MTKITSEMLAEIFGSTMPMAAFSLLADPGRLTTDELLVELRALAGKPGKVWAAGWNVPGYLPDDEPYHFNTWADAREYLLGELERAADDYGRDPGTEALVREYNEAYACLRDMTPEQRFSERVANYVWWIEQITPRD